jgi:hypothetical protein
MTRRRDPAAGRVRAARAPLPTPGPAADLDRDHARSTARLALALRPAARRLPELTDAGAGSYIEFLALGVVVASAFSHGAWDGTTTVSELEHGTFERFLATPLVPSAPLLAQPAQAALTGAAQGLVVLLTALGLGVRVHAGVAGWAIVLAAAALAAAAFAGVSHALALLLRRRSAGRSPPPVARPSPTPTGRPSQPASEDSACSRQPRPHWRWPRTIITAVRSDHNAHPDTARV